MDSWSGSKCAAIFCPNFNPKVYKENKPSLHRFPKTPIRAKKWLLFAENDKLWNIPPAKLYNFRLCINHFCPSLAHSIGKQKFRLHYGAIPTIRGEERARYKTQKRQEYSASVIQENNWDHDYTTKFEEVSESEPTSMLQADDVANNKIEIYEKRLVDEWTRLQTSAGFDCQLTFCEFLLQQEKQRQSLSRDNNQSVRNSLPALLKENTSFKRDQYSPPSVRDLNCNRSSVNAIGQCISYPDLELDDVADGARINPVHDFAQDILEDTDGDVDDNREIDLDNMTLRLVSAPAMCDDKSAVNDQSPTAGVSQKCDVSSGNYKCNVCQAVFGKCYLLIAHSRKEHEPQLKGSKAGVDFSTKAIPTEMSKSSTKAEVGNTTSRVLFAAKLAQEDALTPIAIKQQKAVNVRLIRKEPASDRTNKHAKCVISNGNPSEIDIIADVNAGATENKNDSTDLKDPHKRVRKRGFTCIVCEQVLVSFYQLLKHDAKKHGGKSADAIWSAATSMGFSCDKAVEFQCSVCKQEMKSGATLRRHYLTKHKDCGEPPGEVNANQPENRPKAEQVQYICVICLVPFRAKYQLEVHCLQYHLDKVDLSKENGTVASELVDPTPRQRNSIKPTRGFPCQVCDQVVSSFHQLLVHDQKKHGGESADMITAAAAEMGFSCQPDLEFQCSVCKRALKSEVTLRRHYLTKHNELVGSPAAAVEEGSISLEKRSKEKQVKYECGKCRVPFTAKHLLEIHCLQYHLDKVEDDGYVHEREKKLYLCDICGKVYDRTNRNSKSYIHHRRQHREPDAKRTCHVCGKQFRNHKYYLYHMRSFHPAGGGPPIPKKLVKKVCYICGDVLSGSQSLINHLALHANIKSHVCDLCGKAFPVKRYLQLHKLNNHGVGTKKYYACSHCDQSYRSKMSRNWHVIKVHGTPEEVREKWHLNPNKNKVYKKTKADS